MTSWSCIYNLWSELGWFSVQLFVVVSRGPNWWTSFNRISSLKGQLVLWFALSIAFKAAADQGIGLYVQIFFRTRLFFAARFIYWGSVFTSRLRTRVFSVLFSSVNWILSGSWSRQRVIFSKLISEPACSSQVDLHWASPHLPWRVQSICGPFFFRICLSFERFCQPACFFAARFTLRKPKTPVRNPTNLRTFCFEDYHYAFQQTLCPVTLAH